MVWVKRLGKTYMTFNRRLVLLLYLLLLLLLNVLINNKTDISRVLTFSTQRKLSGEKYFLFKVLVVSYGHFCPKKGGGAAVLIHTAVDE